VQDVVRGIRSGGTTMFDRRVRTPTLYPSQFVGVRGLRMITPGYTDPAARTGIDNASRVFDTDGSINNVLLGLTTANAKALGLFDDDGAPDATITFSSAFKFDFDPRNGIGAGRTDFVGTAIHEMGHVLGFVSGVDDYDVFGKPNGAAIDQPCFADGTLCADYPANDDWFGKPLDLFRYAQRDDGKALLDWAPGDDAYFSINRGLSAFKGAAFSTGVYHGDGNQASHWTDNLYDFGSPGCFSFTAAVGIMDPTGGPCEGGIVTAIDLAAFDAIGWNMRVNVISRRGYSETSASIYAQYGVPEPATWAQLMLGFGLIGAAIRTRPMIARA
jgi:hypothetical protein